MSQEADPARERPDERAEPNVCVCVCVVDKTAHCHVLLAMHASLPRAAFCCSRAKASHHDHKLQSQSQHSCSQQQR